MAASRSMQLAPIYSRIISKFPPNFSFCFAYGSGVKKQLTAANNADQTANMIDLIYCVDHPKKWHQNNLKDHATHYSFLKHLGPKFIASYQENSGAKVYFNTLVPIEGTLIKYGVISTSDLITDLLDWSDLYVAGRLHKPVEIIKYPTKPEIETALQLNLQSAVHAALLILPNTFSEYEFYYTISNLSYAGDFRMTFGENKNKVYNIVKPQLAGFRNLYKSILSGLTDYADFPVLKDAHQDGAVCSQDTNPLAKLHHLNHLPKCPQKMLTRFWNRGQFKQDTEDVLRAIAYDPDCSAVVEQCISEIVWRSSVWQSLKGVLTAGVVKSVQYSGRKIAKMFK
ncbi:phosphatidate cytidylyltransferase, mitochondrial [Atheta coriaria]|uniref:phosphatidate cytidylyltransferase, mitochondrial n=1 Tax=Dalotia coriaria TaxID=877792 RepID=UPI0031F3FF30